MTTTLTITMPLPPKELWQNRPCHWRKKSEATRSYRTIAMLHGAANCVFMDSLPLESAKAKLVFYWLDKRRRDIRNAEAAMKPAYDGLVDAGIIVDDDYNHLIHDTTEFKFDKENPRVEITVSEVT